jgi:glyceraldehyde-3-phosphate dehydrogenase/erythrose-4-phosphate dehydrogenase
MRPQCPARIAEAGAKDIEVVGINDLGRGRTNAHLLRSAACMADSPAR